jgi:hypothetical protein
MCGREKSPSRLWNASTQCLEEEVHGSYAAVSYVWSDYMDIMLRDILSKPATQIGIEYFWVDWWCIKQDDERDKAAEIPRMADYYSRAAHTIILADMVDSRVRGS